MRMSNSIRWLSIALVMLAMCSAASAGVFISVNFGPPPLPVYAQPLCPGPGYIWTPGYWAYGPAGYYWVPGTWVIAPRPGLLWTPGYWGFAAGVYGWHPGYWGPTVGFYGGINYGFGYTGVGYAGGYWRGREFFYNRTVNNVNVVNVHNVYNTTVINNNTTINRVSFNGGPGGVVARPTAAEQVAERQQHISATAVQTRHETMARNNPDLRASVNHGKPAIAATVRPSEFSRGAIAASRAGAPYRAPETAGKEAHANAVPRPGSVSRPGNAARPANPRAENPRAENAMHSSVPRPPSSYRETNAARNENMTASRSNTPRPSSTYRPSSEPRAQTGQPRAQNYPRPSVTNHAQGTSRPQAKSRIEQASRQPSHYNAPRPQNEARPQAAPPRRAQPHVEAHHEGGSRGERSGGQRPQR